jgi:hypothetical protein
MIESSLLEEGWPSDAFMVVPAPISEPLRLASYLPSPDMSVALITIYDEWGRVKKKELEKLGFQVEVLWERSMKDRITSGYYLRRAISTKEPWRHLVPEPVAQYVDTLGDDFLMRVQSPTEAGGR